MVIMRHSSPCCSTPYNNHKDTHLSWAHPTIGSVVGPDDYQGVVLNVNCEGDNNCKRWVTTHHGLLPLLS